MAQRKCSNCGHWNVDLDYCEKCNTVLNLEIKSKIERQQKLRNEPEKEPDTLDRLVDWFRYNKFLPIRAIYYVFHSVWVMLVALLTFFVYAIAWAPG